MKAARHVQVASNGRKGVPSYESIRGAISLHRCLIHSRQLRSMYVGGMLIQPARVQFLDCLEVLIRHRQLGSRFEERRVPLLQQHLSILDAPIERPTAILLQSQRRDVQQTGLQVIARPAQRFRPRLRQPSNPSLHRHHLARRVADHTSQSIALLPTNPLHRLQAKFENLSHNGQPLAAH